MKDNEILVNKTLHLQMGIWHETGNMVRLLEDAKRLARDFQREPAVITWQREYSAQDGSPHRYEYAPVAIYTPAELREMQ